MTVREVKKLLRKDGWEYAYSRGGHDYYVHPSKPGKVTVPAHGAKDLKVKTLNSILKQAGLK